MGRRIGSRRKARQLAEKARRAAFEEDWARRDAERAEARKVQEAADAEARKVQEAADAEARKLRSAALRAQLEALSPLWSEARALAETNGVRVYTPDPDPDSALAQPLFFTGLDTVSPMVSVHIADLIRLMNGRDST